MRIIYFIEIDKVAIIKVLYNMSCKIHYVCNLVTVYILSYRKNNDFFYERNYV